VYFDNTGLPLGQFGLDIAAYYYNASRRWHEGRLEAVINGKVLTAQQSAALVADIERGFSEEIRPLPWQTDTCIGDWHYRRSLFEEHRYKSARTVITRLIDIVSKNGNLLMLATGAQLSFSRDAAGLRIHLPAAMPGEHAFAFRILGQGLTVATAA
jgi:alpha-L-fucosidase